MSANRTFLCLMLALLLGMFAGCSGSSAPTGDAPTDEPFLVGKPEMPKDASVYTDASVDYAWDLIAGQNQNAGTVRVYNNSNSLFVVYSLANGFLMSEAHVYVGAAPPDHRGAPGQFPYGANFNPAVASYTFEIPLSSLAAKSRIYVAVHAAANGETLWGGRWNNGAPSYEYRWSKKWGGYFDTNVMPVFAPVLDWKTYSAAHYGATSYWGVNFSTQGWYPFPGSNTWTGWCVDQAHTMYANSPYRVQVYSCYDPALPAFAQSDNWDMVSYLVNQRRAGTGIYNQNWSSNGDGNWTTVDCPKDHFQKALWWLVGGGSPPAVGSLGEQFLQDALANGDSYIPGTGQWYAVILFPDTSSNSNTVRAQMNIIEVDP